MRRDFVKNGRAQRLHVYFCFMKERCNKKVRLYINEKSGTYEQMCKLPSNIDVLKSSRAQRLHNYYGLRKSRVDSGTRFWSTMWSCFFNIFAPLARFWVPFWAELDPKGGPKIMFLGIMLEKWWKKGVRKRDPKKHQKLIEICSQNERVWEVKMSVSLGKCCKIMVFGEPWNIEKIGANRGPKNDQNRIQKRSEIRFLRFLGVFGGTGI